MQSMIPFEPLTGYTVTGIDTNTTPALVCLDRLEHPNECVHCQSPLLQRFGRRPQHIADLPPAPAMQVKLAITTQRYLCLACRKTFYEPLPGLASNHAMTHRLYVWIGPEAEKKQFTAIAKEVGIAETTVRKVFQEYLDHRKALPRDRQTVTTLTLANVSVIRSACAIAGGERGNLIDLLSNRRLATLTEALVEISRHAPISSVCIEPIDVQRDAVKSALPAARLSIDPNAIQTITCAVMHKVFEQAIGRVPADVRATTPLEEKVLMKAAGELTDVEEEALYEWSRRYPVINEAYQAKEHLAEVLRQLRKNQKLDYTHWWKTVPAPIRSPFKPLHQFFAEWSDELNAGAEISSVPPSDIATTTESRFATLGRQYSFRVVRELLLMSDT